MESTALLSSLNVIVTWLCQRVIGIFSYLRKEANIDLETEAKATATRGIFRTSTIFGFKLGEWKLFLSCHLSGTPTERAGTVWGEAGVMEEGRGWKSESSSGFHHEWHMSLCYLVSARASSWSSLLQWVLCTAIPGGRKDSVKVMCIAVSVTVDRRGLQDSWVITSLEKQHPPFPCLQPRTLQFMIVSCILYEELGDRSTKILNTMEMLISPSKPSYTVCMSQIIILCLTNTCDKKK